MMLLKASVVLEQSVIAAVRLVTLLETFSLGTNISQSENFHFDVVPTFYKQMLDFPQSKLLMDC